MIGSYQRSKIDIFKHAATFTAGDYDVLVAILQQFSTAVTTPHILTEVSNLSNSLPEYLKDSWWESTLNCS